MLEEGGSAGKDVGPSWRVVLQDGATVQVAVSLLESAADLTAVPTVQVNLAERK